MLTAWQRTPSSTPPRPRRPLWRRLLPWLTVLTAVPFAALFLGTGIASHFHCHITGDPPHGPPCLVGNTNIEPITSLLQDTGEGALLTVFLVPVVAAGWIAVGVQRWRRGNGAV